MTTREIDKLKGRLIQVAWDNGQQGSLRIIHRRPKSDIVETEAGQVFEGKLMRLIAVFNGVE